MNTHADKTQGNKSQSVSSDHSQLQSGGESTFEFVDNRPEAIAQRKLQEMANNHKKNSSQFIFMDNRPETITQRKRQEIANSSPQVKQAAQLKSTIGNYSSQQVIQMVRSVMREEGEIEEVEDNYELKPGEEFISDKLKNAEIKGHEAELARFRELGAAKEKGPIMDIRPMSNGNSATLSHLNTPYVDKNMRPRSRLMYGVTTRFLTPTPDAEDDGGPKKRKISPEQVEKYKSIGQQAIAKEQETRDSHYTFYHAQDPRMRVAQDVYKRVYASHYVKELPEDFHFLRFPGPNDDEFRKHKNVQSYFEEDMAKHGMIDDNINPTKTHLTSVNPALHGGLGHAGEETFHYFQIGQGQTELPIAAIMGGFLDKFGLDSSGTVELYKRAAALNATKEGSLFQIMVPKEKVDDVAYMAHPHGLPHDDELFDDLHGMGEIRYPQREGTEKQLGLPPREKMNDEVTRNLLNMREAHQAPDAKRPDLLAQYPENPLERKEAIKQRSQQTRTAFLQERTRELNERTVGRFRKGAYSPSKHLEDFIHDPGKLQHPEGHAQKLRMEMNPEHFGGQGVRSPHELMRIQNRSTFMQARLHFSESTTLNPDSGIRIKRFTTMEPKQEEEYNQMLDEYVRQLFNKMNRDKEEGSF